MVIYDNSKVVKMVIFDYCKNQLMTDKEQIQQDIGMRIREIREIKGISQKDLSYSCGFDKSNMARLEMGRTNPTIYTLKKIAENLNVELEELVKGL